jgi:hypothetical protein
MASGMPRPESNQRTRLRKPLTAVMPRRAPPEFKATEMRVTLHRCGTPRRFGPCRRVQKSLVEEGIPYEVAAEPWRPKKRTIVLEGTGQSLYQNTGSKPGGFKPSARRTHELGTGFCRQWRQRRMEPLWCPAVAIGGNQWQMDREAQPLKQAKTVAVGCDRLPESFHGKEGVDGSSPPGGLCKSPGNRLFPVCVQSLGRPGWSRLWSFRVENGGSKADVLARLAVVAYPA